MKYISILLAIAILFLLPFCPPSQDGSSGGLGADEISDRERELREMQAQIEQRRRAAQEAEARKRAEEQQRQREQSQRASTQTRLQYLSTQEQTLQRIIEQTRRIHSITESKLSTLQRNTHQTMYYLLLADQRGVNNDSYLLGEYMKHLIAENKKLNTELVRIRTDASTREQELGRTREEASSERIKLTATEQALQQIERNISQYERQRQEAQNAANALERSARELQTLVNTLREQAQAQQYQHTYTFPTGVEPPVRGRIVTPFGPKRDERYNIQTISNGVDIAVPENTPVRAIADGQVVFSASFSGLGRMIIIDHKNGYHSVYAYNNSLLVRRDEEVRKGQTIAESGRKSSDEPPSLHFEIRRGGSPINPLDVVRITP